MFSEPTWSQLLMRMQIITTFWAVGLLKQQVMFKSKINYIEPAELSL